MSVLMSPLALTFPKSQNTFQDLLTGKFTPMHFLLFILNYGNSPLCCEAYETKIEKASLKLEKSYILNITSERNTKKSKFLLILYVRFHFTRNYANNLYKIMDLNYAYQNT